jgi:hypothetical protein
MLHAAFIVFATLLSASSVQAQAGRSADDVMLLLRNDIAGYLERNVQPVMAELKEQFDASLKQIDIARLESIRRQARELFNRMFTHADSFAKARARNDFRTAVDHRSRLESGFDSRHRLLGEARRIGQRSGPALDLLRSRLDLTKEEWRAGAIRIFIEWFARNQVTIRPMLSDDSNHELVAFMSAAKDLRLEESGDDEVYHFMLWDGSDFASAIRGGSLPETPVTRVGPSREHTILFEPCSPQTFSQTTTLRFTLPFSGRTRIQAFDARGREVSTLLDEDLGAGKHSLIFNGDRLPTGSYFFLLSCRDLADVQVAQLSR